VNDSYSTWSINHYTKLDEAGDDEH